jgi:valyl-tRNA synthetase
MTEDESTLPKTYDPERVEPDISRTWIESGAFRATPDDRPLDRTYVIMMPLPNVTGALHLGHAIDNVMQDLLIRWHRMMGDNTLWMPGTDHAGIATQAVVEKRLKELEGKTRHDLGREALVRRIWEWKDQYQARIIEQQQRMGCSCDWSRQRFTMDAVCARAVRHSFFRMFRDGLVFRGKRLVNWDVFLQTSVSDDEVYHETVAGHFWHLVYPVIDPRPGEPTSVSVVTTRPETMLGDTAVAVHPDSAGALRARIEKTREALEKTHGKERPALEAQLADLEERVRTVLPTLEKLADMARAGRHVRLPLVDRSIPMIRDDWAKPELGSGCVKITPAHDHNDYDVWTRHRDEIDIINILRPDGTLNESAGRYTGLDRYEAREKVVEDLRSLGLLGEIEDRDVEIGHSDRSKTPIEPYLSDQWYVRMGDVEGGVVMARGTGKEHRATGLVQAAMDAVTSGRVRFHPERYATTYLDWLAEKRDWPISRQLWWGHRIPVWARQGLWAGLDVAGLASLLREGEGRVAIRVHRLDAGDSVALDAVESAARLGIAPSERCSIDVCLLEDDEALTTMLDQLGFERDPDVLDTWYSSALWPFSTLGWPDPGSAPVGEGQTPLGSVGGRPDCLSAYYPGSCLVTARDIITLWVARMVLAGLYDVGDVPFSDVFIHANILDGKGERMSKSKGNGIDPVDIIERYGADAMRYVLCDAQTGAQDIKLPVAAICPTCGHHNDLTKTRTGHSIFVRVCGSCGNELDILGTLPDLPRGKLISERFDEGRAFCTKLWNSARFAFMNLHADDAGAGAFDPAELEIEDRWVLDGLDRTVATVTRCLEEYDPSGALGAARDWFWGSLCDWYLELIKPRLQQPGSASARTARRVLAYALDQVLRLIHPFVPFISEHLWGRLGEIVPSRGLGDFAPLDRSNLLITARWPEPRPAFARPDLRESFAVLQQITRAVREIRASSGVGPRAPLSVTIRTTDEHAKALAMDFHVVERLAFIESVGFDPRAVRKPGSAVAVLGDLQLFVHGVIDDQAERQRLTKERAKLLKDVEGTEKRLTNPSFVAKAPVEVVRELRERLEGFKARLDLVERTLRELEGLSPTG